MGAAILSLLVPNSEWKLCKMASFLQWDGVSFILNFWNSFDPDIVIPISSINA
jgi:hypothetical protein